MTDTDWDPSLTDCNLAQQAGGMTLYSHLLSVHKRNPVLMRGLRESERLALHRSLSQDAHETIERERKE